MQHEFNEQEYRRRLIEGGLSEADATNLAARTAAARRDSVSSSGTFRSAGSLFGLQEPADTDKQETLPLKRPKQARAAAKRSVRIVQEPLDLAPSQDQPSKRRTAVRKNSEQIESLAEEKRSTAKVSRKRTSVTDPVGHTATAPRDSGSPGGSFSTAGPLFESPEVTGTDQQEAAQPLKRPKPARAAVKRAVRTATEPSGLEPTSVQPPKRRTAVKKMAEQVESLAEEKRSTAMAARKREAVTDLSEKVSESQQTALLKHTKQQIKDMHLSLFDLAPWPDHMRALPNDIGRSAIFTVRNKKVPRAALQGQLIYHVNKDVEITYTGIELRADDDELVFAQVLEYAKRTALGEPISFTFYEICMDLGWSINGRYYKKAEECLTRLQASAMQFSSQRIGRLESLSLIRRFRVLDRGKRTSRCQVEIDSEIVMLFAGDHYTKFVWEKYRSLSPTARRMFDYFATHKEPFPLKLETFRLMCGSDSTRPKKWREQVGGACEELCEIGLVESAWVNNDLVHCKR